MRGEFYDLIPGGGPAYFSGLIAPSGKLQALCKGAKQPDPPPPITAPTRPDTETEGDATRIARRKKGIEATILNQQPGTPTPGKRGPPGMTLGQVPSYGGER